MSDINAKVLVLMGGPDAERDVSIASGSEVAEALRLCNRFEVIEQIVDKPTASEIASISCDVIFPVLHGQWGEGGPLQKELELTDIPYIGSGPEASALAMDKLKTKSLLSPHGILTPQSIELNVDETCSIKPPLVIKPVDDGSSVDIRICHTVEEVNQSREELHKLRPRLMAESYIKGRELTVGILNGNILPLIEIVPTVDFYDYDAKYERDDTNYLLDPDVSPSVIETCNSASRLSWDLVGCRDVARADFLLDDEGRVWFLEINTMPGFTTHSLLPLAARHIGLAMPQLCASLVDAAISRSAKPANAAEVAR